MARLVMLSMFPPSRDGIGRYAGQMAEELSGQVAVTRIGIGPMSGGDLTIDVNRWPYALRALGPVGRDAEFFVHWHPHYFTGGRFEQRLVRLLALIALVHVRDVTFLVHEPDDPSRAEGWRPRDLALRLEAAVRELFWSRPGCYVFHTAFELQQHLEAHPRGRRRRFARLEHGESFVEAVTHDRRSARRQLGLPLDIVTFACLGFIGPHKGFDRAVEALAATGRTDAHLYVVGVQMREDPATNAYMEDFRADAAAQPATTLRETYSSDEEFDLWLQAADAVIVPYRMAASSSVVPRCRLFGTPVITSGAGGIREQIGDGDVVFETDGELVDLLRRFTAADPLRSADVS